jgi:hypothetical protein
MTSITPTQQTGTRNQIAGRLAVGLSVIALLLSSWTMVSSIEDDADQRRIESRLACLELPGPNDCGADR